MTKLKTLKDLKETFGNSTSGFEFINPKKVKQEAIKDYNHYKERIIKHCGSIEKSMCVLCAELYAIMVYIKWKNNIVEDDLK